MKLFPFLEEHLIALNRRQILHGCRDICCAAYDAATNNLSIRPPALSLGPRPTSLLRSFRLDVFPILLDVIASSPALPPSVACPLVDVVVACSRVLRMGWPVDDTGLGKGIVPAITKFSRWIRLHSPLSSLQTQGVLDFAAHVIVMIVQNATLDPLLDVMITELFLMACELSGTLFATPSSLAVSSSNVARSLTTLFISRKFLMNQNMISSTTAQVLAVELARHAMVSVSYCSGLQMPEGLAAVRHLLEFLTHMDLASSSRDRVTLARFVRALHLCATKHPVLSFVCCEVVKKQHLEAPHDEEFTAMLVTLHICVRRALSWMRLRTRDGMLRHTLRLELEMIANISIQVASPTVPREEYGEVRRVLGMTIAAALVKPGFLRATEALLRGTDLSRTPNGVARCLIGAASLVHMLVVSTELPSAALYRTLQSLTITIHKVILRLELVEGVTWGCMHMHMTAAVMSNILTALTGCDDLDCCRLYRVIAVCLRTLLRNSCSLTSLDVGPDCDEQPILWLECLTAHAQRFPATRLLLGCASLGCTNLHGLLDSHLPTLLCGGCGKVRYCSVDCQMRDWAKGGHGRVCA